MRLKIRRLSPAMVVGCTALAVALGGTSYAAVVNVPRNSVGTAHLKNGAVGSPKPKSNTVVSSKIKDGSLLADDFAPAGPVGLAEPAAPRSHSHGLVTKRVRRTLEVDSETLVVLTCPRGYVLASHGYWMISGFPAVSMRETSATVVFTIRPEADRKRAGRDGAVGLEITCIKSLERARDARGGWHTHRLQQRIQAKEVRVEGTGTPVKARLACPPGFFAVQGSASLAPDSVLTGSTPSRDGTGWTYEVTNLADGGSATNSAYARCLGNQTTEAAMHRHPVRHAIVRKQVQIPSAPVPRESTVPVSGTITCPAGYTPVGFGHWADTLHPYTYLGGVQPSGTTNMLGYTFHNRSTAHNRTAAAVCVGRRTAASQ